MNVKMIESSGLCVMCTLHDTNWIDEEGDRICEFCQDESEYKRSVVELRQRAEVAEARAERAEAYIRQDFFKPLYEQRDAAINRAEAAEARVEALLEENRELSESVATLRAERDELRRQLEQAQREISEQQAMIGSVVKAVTA